jgi:hypothetical protein
MQLLGWQAVNGPLKGGQLTTTPAMGNWSIIDRVIDQLTTELRRLALRYVVSASFW